MDENNGINDTFSSLNSHYIQVNSDYEQIKTAYEYVRDTCQPNIQDSTEKINSDKNINGFEVNGKIIEIDAKLMESRRELDKCFTSNTEWADYYAGRILMKILVECETAKYKYLKDENIVNNCYGFDIDHPTRADNFLCCESE